MRKKFKKIKKQKSKCTDRICFILCKGFAIHSHTHNSNSTEQNHTYMKILPLPSPR